MDGTATGEWKVTLHRKVLYYCGGLSKRVCSTFEWLYSSVVAPSDYPAVNRTVAIQPGRTTASFSMRTIRNTSPQEINEMFSVSVSPPAECGNLVAGQQADVTICDSTSEYAIKCIELAVLCLLCAVLGS